MSGRGVAALQSLLVLAYPVSKQREREVQTNRRRFLQAALQSLLVPAFPAPQQRVRDMKNQAAQNPAGGDSEPAAPSVPRAAAELSAGANQAKKRERELAEEAHGAAEPVWKPKQTTHLVRKALRDAERLSRRLAAGRVT